MYKHAPIRKTVVKYGLVSGSIITIYSYILLKNQLIQDIILGNLDYLFMIAIIVLAFKEYKDSNSSYMTFKTGVRLGTLVFLLTGSIISIFDYIYLSYFDTEFVDYMLELAQIELEKSNLTEGNIDLFMKIYKKYIITPTSLALINLCVYFFAGLFITIITAAFMRKKQI